MKKTIFLIAAFVLAAVMAHAQIEKGNQTLGLNLGYVYSNANGISVNPYDNSSMGQGSKNIRFNIGPFYSYFIANNLDLGANITYNWSQDSYPYPQSSGMKQLMHQYGATVFVRRYCMFKDKFGLRTSAYAGYSRENIKLTYEGPSAIYDSNSKIDNYGGSLNLELVYYPTKSFGFSAYLAGVGYTHYRNDSGASGHLDGDALDASFINNGLTLSVFYVLGGK